MNNEQKLREFSEWLDTYRDLPVHEVFHEIVLRYEEALTSTEPEPTGMPELPEPDHKADRWPTSHVYTTNQMRDYGEQCWKAVWQARAKDEQ